MDIKNYHNLEQISTSSQNTGYIGHDEDGNKVFLKRYGPLPTSGIERDIKQSQFLRESRLLLALDYPTFPKYKEAFGSSDDCYIAMNFINGENLSDIVSRKPMYEKEIKDIGKKVAIGLSYLHERKIIHGDIKPDNLIRGVNGSIFIVDFGSAPYDGLDTNKCWSATRSYAPPEFFEEDGVANPAGDVYSLGMTLATLSMNRIVHWEEILEGDLPLSYKFQDLIVQMCDFLPNLRPSAADVAKKLE